LLASLPETQRTREIARLSEAERDALLYHWPFWARPEQLAPKGDWTNWLILAGRGWGKTRTGSEWVRSVMCGATPLARGTYGRIAIIAETAADARDVIVNGTSGIMVSHPSDFRPIYVANNRSLTWPNGAIALLFNATEPDQLRGPEHEAAWLDELAKWRYAQETYDMLQFGLRIGDDPKQVITTTPRPIKIVKELVNDPDTVVTRGLTTDNRSNLSAKFYKKIVAKYEGTRLGRQELMAELLTDVPGALWTQRGLDEHRWDRKKRLPDMARIVIGVDPAAKDPNKGMPEDGAETGIVAVGLGMDGRGYVFEDGSCRLGPMGWARRAIALYDRYQADAVVAEINQGGAMVEAVLRSERPTLPVTTVHASRGKVTRAEPIAALYEQGRISHCGAFPELEDQQVLFTPNGIEGETTADRVDALVWALTELFPNIIFRPADDDEDDPWSRNRGRSMETGY
jgi:phage terminase large subunit-like protein